MILGRIVKQKECQPLAVSQCEYTLNPPFAIQGFPPLFSRDAENSSREIVSPNANTPDEFVNEE